MARRRLLGDPVPMVFKDSGPQSLRVAMIYDEDQAVGPYILGIEAYRANFANQYDQRIFVKKAAGVSLADTRAAVGAAIGARTVYVINHWSDYSSPVEWFQVWEGGISLLGGIFGGIAGSHWHTKLERDVYGAVPGAEWRDRRCLGAVGPAGDPRRRRQ